MSGKAIRLGLAGMATACALSPGLAQAAPAPDVATLQQEMEAMRADYEARMSALEARINAATAAASNDAISTLPGYADAAPTPVTSSANAMNPGVSVVLNGNYFASKRDPATLGIAGIPPGDEAGLPSRGFSLGESEVTFAANVDPYFTAALTASLDGAGAANVEEAYVQTTALKGGVTLKGGRFFSAIGYLNERHAHNWAFIDMPLPYRAFLNGQYGDDGVQARWLAPTPFFLEIGAEAFRGDAFPAGNWDRNRPGTQAAFVHTGADINASSSWAASLSYLHGSAANRFTDPGDLFTGTTDLGIAALVYKWAPGGNPVNRNFNFSAEYFLDKEKGGFDAVAVNRRNSGWYAQGVYQFRPRWSVGGRYSTLDVGKTPVALAGTTMNSLGHTPSNASLLVEYDTSEFARLRAQYTRNMADPLINNDELMLQYTVVFGPHGAHRY